VPDTIFIILIINRYFCRRCRCTS